MVYPVLGCGTCNIDVYWRFLYVSEVPQEDAERRRKVRYGLGRVLC